MRKIISFVTDALFRFPNSCFIEDKIYTYKEIGCLINYYSDVLKKRCNERAKVCVLCEKQINASIMILSCWQANVVPIPLSLHYGEKQVEKICMNIQPDVILVDSGTVIDGFSDSIINIFDDDIYNSKHIENVREEELDEVALVMHTSGTTGLPKGSMITEEGLIKNILAISEYFQISSNDTILISRPLYHCAVLTGEFLVSLYNGVNIVFSSSKFDIWRCINQIIDNKVTIFCSTPTFLTYMVKNCIRNNISISLSTVAVSGERLMCEAAELISSYFTGARIFNVYGLTEASPRVTYLPYENFNCNYDSVGVPLRGVEIAIIDEDGKKVKDKVVGNVIVRSPCIMKGYYKMREETERKIKNGWLHTGDVGYIKNGELYLLSRIDDMIIKGGMNIYPQEIENIVNKFEEVEKSLAYGIQGEISQGIGLDVVLKIKEISKKEFISKVSRNLPQYLMPDKINFVKSIKVNASGKMVRKYD